MLLDYNPLHCLPSSEELPDSDDTPVDNQLQHLIPTLLEAILALIWAERQDWYFGVDMGIYYHENEPAIVPDGFLSLGVERFIDEQLRLSYVLWEEQKVPIFALEVVSQKYRGEYSTKKQIYGELGILFYAVYNPRRRRKPPLEVYRLENKEYVLLSGNPIWLPEINLGLGQKLGTYQGITREWLYWYDEQGQKFLTPEERIQTAEQLRLEAEQNALLEQQRRLEAEQKAQILAQRLRELGIDPETLT
ncbi:Uma2 family endonuclease [Microseira sp. BLCC-F43]|uniref:Uma2 family endonuclease n=1 Tax=Microseira sp. BLCC-F43 TaxID=3153602 RepID=UPI0035BA4FEA